MGGMSTTEVTTGTLPVPGARLYYEVRGSGPLILLIGNPMDANPFAPLADLLATDHTVVTTDPRGINRSPVDDPTQDVAAETRADGPFEPADPPRVRAGDGLRFERRRSQRLGPRRRPPRSTRHCRRPRAAAAPAVAGQRGRRPAWKRWSPAISTETSVVPGASSWPMPISNSGRVTRAAVPARAGPAGGHRRAVLLRAPAAPDHPLAARPGRPAPQLARIVVGIGVESGGQLCDRTSCALADSIGTEPTYFPGGHTGFAEDPVAFAARLRMVLGES